MSGALRHAEGWRQNHWTDETTASGTHEPRHSLPVLWRAIGGYSLLLVILVGVAAGIRPGSSSWFDGLAQAVGAFGERNWVLDGVRLAGQPRSFFQWEAEPLWLFLAYWCARSLLRLFEAMDLWATGGVPEEADEDLNGGNLAPRPSKEPPGFAVRLRTALQDLAFPTLLFIFLGFLWRQWIGSGHLGVLVGRPTPEGAAAGLFLLAMFLYSCLLLEALRCGRDLEPSATPRAVRDACRSWGKSAGTAALFALLVGLAGGNLPLREIAGVVPGLLLASGAAIGFGLGWRHFRNRMLLGPAGPLTTVLRGMLHAWVWVATYLLPAAALFGASADPRVHAVAAVSPLYLLFCQFSPVRATALIPVWMAGGLPVLAGALLALLAAHRKPAPEETRTTERDPTMTALFRVAEAWDNAIFTMALRRRELHETALTVRLIRAPIVMGIVSAAGAYLLAIQAGRGSWQTFPQVLEVASFVPGLTVGALSALLAAAGSLALGLMFSSNVYGSIAGERLGTSHRQHRQDLRLSPLSDSEIVRGSLWGNVVTVLPTLCASLATALFWVMAAVYHDSGWHWFPVWAGAATVFTCLVLHHGLEAFGQWPRKAAPSLRQRLAALSAPLLLAAGALLTFAGHPLDIQSSLPVVLPGLFLLAGAVGMGTLPIAFRHAEQWVKASREDDAPLPLN